MKTVSYIIPELKKPIHTISASAQVSSPSMNWIPASIDDSGIAGAYHHDACSVGDEIFRIAVMANGQVKHQRSTSVSSMGTWYTTTGVIVKSGSYPGVARDATDTSKAHIIYQSVTGYLCRATVEFGVGIEIQSFDPFFSNPVAIAPGYNHSSTAECAILHRGLIENYADPDNVTEPYGSIGRLYWSDLFTGSVKPHHGRIYSNGEDIDRFDMTYNGTVFYTENSSKRCMRVVFDGKNWGSPSPIFGIDEIDDTMTFYFSGAENMQLFNGHGIMYDSKDVVVGVEKRVEIFGDQYIHVLISAHEEHFSSGKRKVIAINSSSSIGKIIKAGDQYIYIGIGMAYCTQISETKTTVPIASFSIDESDGQSVSIQANYVDAALFQTGDYITLSVSVNGEDAVIGVYEIIEQSSSKFYSGQNLQVSARSISRAALAEWTSDAYYDYWSQTKQNALASNMAEFIRSGLWNDDDESQLFLSDINGDGILYTSKKSGRNMMCKALLNIPNDAASDDTPTAGILLAFYRESATEAAKRLPDEDNPEIGNNAIAVLLGKRQANGSCGAGVWLLTNNSWKQITYVAYYFDFSRDIWLEAKFDEGEITVKYRYPEQTSWTELLLSGDFVYGDASRRPWATGNYGKAALYARNVTPALVNLEFSDENSIIPVQGFAYHNEKPSTNTHPDIVFPTPCNVIVENEIISVSGKSPELLVGELEVVRRYTFPDAPHGSIYGQGLNNPYWTTGVLFDEPGEDGDEERIFGELLDNQQLFRSFTSLGGIYVRWVKISMKHVGNTFHRLRCFLATDTYDEYTPDPNAILFSAYYDDYVMESKFSGDDWSDCIFALGDTNGTFLPKENYFFGFYQVDSNNNMIVDPDNYYVVHQSATRKDTNGIVLGWNGSTFDYANIDKSMPFQILGVGNNAKYEIYVRDPVIDGVRKAADNVDRSHYNDCALIVATGNFPGKVFRICDYDCRVPYQWITINPYIPPDTWEDHVGDTLHGFWREDTELRRFFVDEDSTGIIKVGDTIRVYPALIVDERAILETLPGSHSAGIVSRHTTTPVSFKRGQYFTGETDKSFAWMMSELVAKAGGHPAPSEVFASGQFMFSAINIEEAVSSIYPFEKRNLIMGFSRVYGEAGVAFRMRKNNDLYYGGYFVLVSSTSVKFYKRAVSSNSAPTLVETYPNQSSSTSVISISATDEFVSVWQSGRLVVSFPLINDDGDETVYDGTDDNGSSYASAIGIDCEMWAYWSQADMRVDNFVFDAGTTGDALMRTLVGEKPVYVQDGPGDYLVVFTERATITDPVNLLSQKSITQQSAVPTFLRSEGIELVEVYDAGNLKDRGYIFATIKRSEPLSEIEMILDARRILADIQRKSTQISITGVSDPRVQPNDIYKVGNDYIVVTSVRHIMSISDDGAEFDMELTGDLYEGS